jgi:hypothetical protein
MVVDAVGLWPASTRVTAGVHVDAGIDLHNTDPLSVTYGAKKIHLRDDTRTGSLSFYY